MFTSIDYFKVLSIVLLLYRLYTCYFLIGKWRTEFYNFLSLRASWLFCGCSEMMRLVLPLYLSIPVIKKGGLHLTLLLKVLGSRRCPFASLAVHTSFPISTASVFLPNTHFRTCGSSYFLILYPLFDLLKYLRWNVLAGHLNLFLPWFLSN